MISTNLLPDFLYYGYIPKLTPQAATLLRNIGERTQHSSKDLAHDDETQLVQRGVDALQQVLRDTIQRCHAYQLHVLPLSGGLDSRAILGGLMENVPAEQIQCVTFGTPGTLDYEIARNVADSVGVRCESLDLSSSEWQWSLEGLLETAANVATPIWLFDAYVHRQIPTCFGTDCVYWSGFMGDPVAGSHLPSSDSATWEVARVQFARRNRRTRSIALSPSNYDPSTCLPATPLLDSSVLSYDEQLDFAVRQHCLISHIVKPVGFNYQTPFLHPDWIQFMLNLPRKWRESQHLYKAILQAAYPRLFALPTKTNYGLSLGAPRWRRFIQARRRSADFYVRRFFAAFDWAPSPNVNYIDFDRDVRRRDDLKQTIYICIQALQQRKMAGWLDIDGIWQRHQSRTANHADALTLLASLEINLRAGESRRRAAEK